MGERGDVSFRSLGTSLAILLAVSLVPAAYMWLRLRKQPSAAEEASDQKRRRAMGVATLALLFLVAPASLLLFWRGCVLVIVQAAWFMGLASALAVQRPLTLSKVGATVRWSFGQAFVFDGYWYALALSPWVGLSLGGSRAPVAAVVIVAMGLCTLAFGPSLYHFILRTRPWSDGSSPRAFGEILDRAHLSPGPRVMVAPGPPGGRAWANAVAIHDRAGGAVVLGDGLIAALPVNELAAVFAHEVAHLEHARRARRLGDVVRHGVLYLLAAAIAVIAPQINDGLPVGVGLFVWMGIVSGAFRDAARASRREELRADRRAAELCGSGPWLQNALTRLHALAGLPTHWEREIETWLRHPSLARRLAQLERPADGTDRAAPPAQP